MYICFSRLYPHLRTTAEFEEARINYVSPESRADMDFSRLKPPIGATTEFRKKTKKIRLILPNPGASAAYSLLAVIAPLRYTA